MNLLRLFLSCVLSNKFIKNYDAPICVKCIHYRESEYNNNNPELGRCRLFGEKNVITGEVEYDFVSVARKYSKCGENGTYFEENK